MWQRSELKNEAKRNLTGKYWQAFAVSLVVGLLSGGSGLISYNFSLSDLRLSSQRFSFDLDHVFDRIEQFFAGSSPFLFDPHFFQNLPWRGFGLIVILAALLAGSIGILYGIFVSPVIQVGGNRWFSRNREAPATPTIGIIFSLFKTGRYLKTVGSMLWMNFFLFLWSLMAAIPFTTGITLVMISYVIPVTNEQGQIWPDLFNWLPGDPEVAIAAFFALLLAGSLLLALPVIIKGYSYRMTPWILADNPGIGYKRALKLSKQLTRGQKWDIFVLDLSFLGWFILGGLLCGIGLLFVTPYFMAVQAELYARLRRLGVEQGHCSMEELGFYPVNTRPGSDTTAPSPTSGVML